MSENWVWVHLKRLSLLLLLLSQTDWLFVKQEIAAKYWCVWADKNSPTMPTAQLMCILKYITIEMSCGFILYIYVFWKCKRFIARKWDKCFFFSSPHTFVGGIVAVAAATPKRFPSAYKHSMSMMMISACCVCHAPLNVQCQMCQNPNSF